jgi:hypothetical protein
MTDELGVDGGQVGELPAQARTLAGGRLQRHADLRRPGGGKDLVQGAHDLFQPCLLALAQMTSRMHDEERKVQLGAQFQLLGQ